MRDAIAHAHQLNRSGQAAQAVAAYQAILAMAPAQPELWYELARMHRRLGQPEQALDCYSQALRHGIVDPHEVHLNRAVILTDMLHDHAGAETALLEAIEEAPGYHPAWLNLGNLREEQGRRSDALAAYGQILADCGSAPLDAYSGEALARMIGLDPPASTDDARIQRAQAALGDTSLPLEVRANLAFAVARATERLAIEAEQPLAPAFAWYLRANRLAAQGGSAYAPARQEALVERLLTMDRPARQPAAAPFPSASPEPLFICGMFRSGSTLLERILAAHPAIHGAGELEELPRLAVSMRPAFPAGLASLDPDTAQNLASRYLKRLQALVPSEASGIRYISDKRPDNFLLLDLIKRLFPQAKVLHTVRHPLDNGLSVFQQHLSQRAAPYSSDLTAIGHYYGQYHRLMQALDQRYAGDILRVDYDQLVQSPEPVLRTVMDFLGLDWDPSCLAFHRRAGVVKTASYWQVRQPLHRQSSGRWQAYAAELEPLQRALPRAGVPI